jgi:hypothetical protein
MEKGFLQYHLLSSSQNFNRDRSAASRSPCSTSLFFVPWLSRFILEPGVVFFSSSLAVPQLRGGEPSVPSITEPTKSPEASACPLGSRATVSWRSFLMFVIYDPPPINAFSAICLLYTEQSKTSFVLFLFQVTLTKDLDLEEDQKGTDEEH